MMMRDECFRILARHIKDEAVVATYSSAVDWVGVAPRELNYLSIGAMGLDSSHGLGLALGRLDKRVVVLQGGLPTRSGPTRASPKSPPRSQVQNGTGLGSSG